MLFCRRNHLPEVGLLEHAKRLGPSCLGRLRWSNKIVTWRRVMLERCFRHKAGEEVGLGEHFDVSERSVGLNRHPLKDVAPAKPKGTGHVTEPDAENHADEQAVSLILPAEPT